MPRAKRTKKPRPRQETQPQVVVEEGYWSPPTPEEWESLRRFQARIRAALAHKYPLPVTQKEQSA